MKITEALQWDWEEAYQHSRPNSAEPAIVRMILMATPASLSRPLPPRNPAIIPSSSPSPGAPKRGLARTCGDLDPS